MNSNRYFGPAVFLLLLCLAPISDVAAQKGGRGYGGGGRGMKGGGFGGSFSGGKGQGGSKSFGGGSMQGGGKSHGELEKHSSGKRSSFDSQGGFDRSIGGGKNKTGPTFSQPSGNRTFDSTKKGRPDARFQSGSLDGNTVSDPRMQNELRKLNHRQQVADHLRNVSQMNGNPQLMEVADRLDQKALNHYQKQMTQLDPQWQPDSGLLGDASNLDGSGLDGSGLEPSVPQDGLLAETPTTASPSSVLESPSPLESQQPSTAPATSESFGNRLTGTQNAYQRRLEAAESQLNQRMNVAEKLRTLGESQGNPNLLDASRQMEEMALQQYTSQLSKLSDFSTRVPTSIDP